MGEWEDLRGWAPAPVAGHNEGSEANRRELPVSRGLAASVQVTPEIAKVLGVHSTRYKMHPYSNNSEGIDNCYQSVRLKRACGEAPNCRNSRALRFNWSLVCETRNVFTHPCGPQPPQPLSLSASQPLSLAHLRTHCTLAHLHTCTLARNLQHHLHATCSTLPSGAHARVFSPYFNIHAVHLYTLR